ncbi:MAG TPA: TRAP transporter small permease, partial [Syntrophorhabdaceae bacterium]|nr:TRAP transporter small permease [Syntrophorhabdaceae bacterium]
MVKFVFLTSIVKMIHRASTIFAFVSMSVLFLMVIFIDIDVLAGYFFRNPIPGSIDFIIVMMVTIIFSAMGYTTSVDGHVRTDVFYDRLTKRGKGICNIPNTILALFLVGAMTWRLGARVLSILQHPPGINTPYFSWPQYPFMILGT